MTLECELALPIDDYRADPRLREIILSLIKHLHGFARDVRLTGDEYLFAMNYLVQLGGYCKGGRQEFLALDESFFVSGRAVLSRVALRELYEKVAAEERAHGEQERRRHRDEVECQQRGGRGRTRRSRPRCSRT